MSKLSKKKKTSQAKITSNRKNSLKSKGPKTKKGKLAVKWNALKHGLLSKEVIITSGDGQEDEKEYRMLQECLDSQLKPAGIIEEMLVEKIVVCYWRMRRLLKYETGEIQKKLHSAIWEMTLNRINDFNFNQKFTELGDGQTKIKSCSLGIKYLKYILTDIRDCIKSEGCLHETSRDDLIKYFGIEKGSFAHTLLLFDHMIKEGPRLSQEDPESFGEPIDPKRGKTAMLSTIDEELKRLDRLEEMSIDKEEMDSDAEIQSRSLPAKESIDKIIRYETALEKQFYRALHELMRIQNARNGGNPTIPLAIDVNVSSES